MLRFYVPVRADKNFNPATESSVIEDIGLSFQFAINPPQYKLHWLDYCPSARMRKSKLRVPLHIHISAKYCFLSDVNNKKKKT